MTSINKYYNLLWNSAIFAKLRHGFGPVCWSNRLISQQACLCKRQQTAT